MNIYPVQGAVMLAMLLFSAAPTLTGCSTGLPTASHQAAITAIPIKNPSFDADGKGRIADWQMLEHNAGASYTFTPDKSIFYSAPYSARISRHGDEIYGRLDQKISIAPQWIGKTVRMTGVLKTEKVEGGGGALILQAIAADGSISAWNHMHGGRAKGTTDWKAYAIELKTPSNAVLYRFGVMLEDGGTLWADDLKLEILN